MKKLSKLVDIGIFYAYVVFVVSVFLLHHHSSNVYIFNAVQIFVALSTLLYAYIAFITKKYVRTLEFQPLPDNLPSPYEVLVKPVEKVANLIFSVVFHSVAIFYFEFLFYNFAVVTFTILVVFVSLVFLTVHMYRLAEKATRLSKEGR